MKYKIFHGKPASVSERRFLIDHSILQLRDSWIRVTLKGIRVTYPGLGKAILYANASIYSLPCIVSSSWEITERDSL